MPQASRKEKNIIDRILKGEIRATSEQELLALGLPQKDINELKGLSILKFGKQNRNITT